jgi:hypothetical protein
MFTNINLSDMETGCKAFRREVLHSFVIEEDRFGCEPEITAKLARGGWRVYEIGISYAGRTYSQGKKIGWKDGVRALYCIAKYSTLRERIQQRTSGHREAQVAPVGLEEAGEERSADPAIAG